jgi:hypothetical protein
MSRAAAAARPPLQEAGSRLYMPPLSLGSRNPSAMCYVSPLPVLATDILNVICSRVQGVRRFA